MDFFYFTWRIFIYAGGKITVGKEETEKSRKALNMQDLREIEENNRKRLIDLIGQIPKGIPSGWECSTLAVGGLMYVGFSEIHTEKLICISSQGQAIINCDTLQKTYCAKNFDEHDLIACAEELGDELISIAGICGGGLRHSSDNGNHLTKVAPLWPKEQIIFMPDFHSWYTAPDKCQIIFDDYEIIAYGFSKCGKYFVIAASSDLTIFKKQIG